GTAPQLQPVQSSTVQTGTLPPLGGATGTPAPGLSGNPVLGGQSINSTTTLPPVGSSTQTAALGGGLITSVGSPMSTGVSSGPEGAWNVVAGGATCRLNLPLTSKTGTNYYRASAPGCTVPQIA